MNKEGEGLSALHGASGHYNYVKFLERAQRSAVEATTGEQEGSPSSSAIAINSKSKSIESPLPIVGKTLQISGSYDHGRGVLRVLLDTRGLPVILITAVDRFQRQYHQSQSYAQFLKMTDESAGRIETPISIAEEEQLKAQFLRRVPHVVTHIVPDTTGSSLVWVQPTARQQHLQTQQNAAAIKIQASISRGNSGRTTVHLIRMRKDAIAIQRQWIQQRRQPLPKTKVLQLANLTNGSHAATIIQSRVRTYQLRHHTQWQINKSTHQMTEHAATIIQAAQRRHASLKLVEQAQNHRRQEQWKMLEAEQALAGATIVRIGRGHLRNKKAKKKCARQKQMIRQEEARQKSLVLSSMSATRGTTLQWHEADQYATSIQCSWRVYRAVYRVGRKKLIQQLLHQRSKLLRSLRSRPDKVDMIVPMPNAVVDLETQMPRDKSFIMARDKIRNTLILDESRAAARRRRDRIHRPLSPSTVRANFRKVVKLFSQKEEMKYITVSDVLLQQCHHQVGLMSEIDKEVLHNCRLSQLLKPKWYYTTFQMLNTNGNGMLTLNELENYYYGRSILQKDDREERDDNEIQPVVVKVPSMQLHTVEDIQLKRHHNLEVLLEIYLPIHPDPTRSAREEESLETEQKEEIKEKEAIKEKEEIKEKEKTKEKEKPGKIKEIKIEIHVNNVTETMSEINSTAAEIKEFDNDLEILKTNEEMEKKPEAHHHTQSKTRALCENMHGPNENDNTVIATKEDDAVKIKQEKTTPNNTNTEERLDTTREVTNTPEALLLKSPKNTDVVQKEELADKGFEEIKKNPTPSNINRTPETTVEEEDLIEKKKGKNALQKRTKSKLSPTTASPPKMTKGELRRKQLRDVAAKEAEQKITCLKQRKTYKVKVPSLIKTKFNSPKSNRSGTQINLPIPSTQSSEIRKQLLLESRRQIMNSSTEDDSRKQNHISIPLTFNNVERKSPGRWGTIDVLPPIENRKSPFTTGTSPTKRRAKVQGPKQDTLKISIVSDMFDMVFRPRSVDSLIATPLQPNLIQESMDSSSMIMLRSQTAGSNLISSRTPPTRKESRELALKSVMYPLILPPSNGERPIQEKRMEKISDVYLSLTSSLSPSATANKSRSLSPTLYTTSLSSNIDWSKAWENSLQRKQEQKEYEERQRVSAQKRERRKMLQRERIKKREQAEEKKFREEEKVRIDPFQLMLDLEKWLHRSFLRVKDAFLELDTDKSGELDLAEFTRLLPKLGLKMSKKDVTTVFKMIDDDRSNSISLQELDRGIRRFKRRKKLQASTRQRHHGD